MSQERTPRKSRAGSKSDPGGFPIIQIDQAPLRQTAAADCTQAMECLERARVGWHRFERKDKPAFIRWRAREFGALLSRAREVEEQIRDRQSLVHEVEMEMRRGFQDAHTAYQRVMSRRSSNPGAVPDERAEIPLENNSSQNLSDFEKEALFQEWVQRSLGTNPDKMDDDAYLRTFEVFKSHMFRNPIEEPRPRNVSRPAESARPSPEKEEEAVAPVDGRVKQLYRTLVRRLHPDLRVDRNTAVSALWHEVQEAYAASDVARMEILLALSDIESNHMGNQTSVGQMRAVVIELKRSLRALEKSLLEAEGEDAWNFAQAGSNSDLRLRVERQLKSDLAARTMHLELLTKTLAEWARGPIANRKVMPGLRRQFGR